MCVPLLLTYSPDDDEEGSSSLLFSQLKLSTFTKSVGERRTVGSAAGIEEPEPPPPPPELLYSRKRKT